MPNLATSLCGWSAVLTLLYMTAGGTAGSSHTCSTGTRGILPKGSRTGSSDITPSQFRREGGRNERSSHSRQAEKENAPRSSHGGRSSSTFFTAESPHPIRGRSPDRSGTHCGAFVTLYKHRQLRGCIGRFDADEPLYSVVQQMAVASASQDTRFNPVEPSEVKNLRIEISVLTPMRKISSIDEFHLGTQGIYMRKGNRSGTFLPQVAQETNWTKEEFLGHCAEEKAGIGWDGWKDAELYVYEALVFGEPEE